MNAYSKDLKLKVLAAVDRGVPRREVVATFGVSLAALKRWLKRRRESGVSPRGILRAVRHASSSPRRSGAPCGRSLRKTTMPP